MLGAYYLHVDGSVRWVSREKIGKLHPSVYFDTPLIIQYWVIPDKLPGGSIQGGKQWIAETIAEMVELGGKKEDIRQIATDGFSMPESVFQAIYTEVMDRRKVN